MTKTPKRIQRKRTKGWRMPENSTYVGRGSKWGNPYKVGKLQLHTNKEVVEAFENYVHWINEKLGHCLEYDNSAFRWDNIKEELKGKNLACWCKIGDACHGDFLLEVANGE